MHHILRGRSVGLGTGKDSNSATTTNTADAQSAGLKRADELAAKIANKAAEAAEKAVQNGDPVEAAVRNAVTRQLYDTTTNRATAPSMFVTYHDAQAYPEYIVRFREY